VDLKHAYTQDGGATMSCHYTTAKRNSRHWRLTRHRGTPPDYTQRYLRCANKEQ
jgi:hypothetical protein